MISAGQQLLTDYLERLTNRKPTVEVRPDWMEGLEIDIFFEDIDLAVEFQGHHHYSPVFGRHYFRHQREADKRKVVLCEQRGVVLLRVQICDLHHPRIVDMLLNRMMQMYGGEAGRARFYAICGEDPISRKSLMEFIPQFRNYRHVQIFKHGAKSAPANAQERRLLRRALAQRRIA